MENGYIIVIGGINADITGKAVKDVIKNESNIGKITITAGGVARNICENLTRLGADCEFITTYANDYFGDMLQKSCQELNISLVHSYISNDYATGAYVSLEDHIGEMEAAVCDSEGILNLPISHVEKLKVFIKHSQCIVLDCNLSEEMLEYVIKKYHEKKILIEAVSSAKVIKLRKNLNNVYAIKLNRNEFESLYEEPYTTENAQKMSKFYNNKIFVTEGKNGSTGYEKGNAIHINAIPAKLIESVNGAGDAYAAGLAYGFMNGYDIRYSMNIANILSYITLSSKSAVSENISKYKVLTMLKEIN